MASKKPRLSPGEKVKMRAGGNDLCAKIKSNNVKSKSMSKSIEEPVIIASCHDNAIKDTCLSPSGKLTTSDLGGCVSFWKLKGNEGALVKNYDVYWPTSFPEAMAWHPDDARLFGAFKVEKPEAQKSKTQDAPGAQVYFTSETQRKFQPVKSSPHITGAIPCIEFMPWESGGAPCFVTGGSDHLVVSWSEREGEWRGEQLHHGHTSAVYGVSGDSHRNWLLSAGLDKKLIIYDVVESRKVQEAKLDKALLDVKNNPLDPNLFFISQSSEEKQIRLHDVRCFDPEKCEHAFGWKAEKPTATRKIQQCWSPDGLYISTGSLQNEFYVFDIRLNVASPTVTVIGNKSWFLKAEWHPLLTKMIISTTREGNIWVLDWPYC